MKQKSVSLLPGLICSAVLLVFLNACDKDKELAAGDQPAITSAEKTAAARVSESVLLVIDEESIDNGSPPNSFSNVDVNDQLARVGAASNAQVFW